MNGAHLRPTAAELVAAVAEFLETEVREATTGAVGFHVRVAANALRIVERELGDSATPAYLGHTDERELAAAIELGEFDDRADDVRSALRALVLHRLSVAHPGYEHE